MRPKQYHFLWEYLWNEEKTKPHDSQVHLEVKRGWDWLAIATHARTAVTEIR